ncbi:MAG: hypothetical protein RLZZ385_752 [Pseudomonadota bacterium]
MPENGFPKKLRLLKASDFKAVFGQAKFKVSCRNLLVFAMPNELEHARLGLVIGKRHVPKATERNRIKRVLRNAFRLNQKLLQGLDIVILARSELASLDNKMLAMRIDTLWRDLIKKTNTVGSRGPQSNGMET